MHVSKGVGDRHPTRGRLRRALSGAAVAVVASLCWSAPGAVAADTIFWTTPYAANKIYFANLDGSSRGAPATVNTGTATVNAPWGIGLDPAAGKIYWAQLLRQQDLLGEPRRERGRRPQHGRGDREPTGQQCGRRSRRGQALLGEQRWQQDLVGETRRQRRRRYQHRYRDREHSGWRRDRHRVGQDLLGQLQQHHRQQDLLCQVGQRRRGRSEHHRHDGQCPVGSHDLVCPRQGVLGQLPDQRIRFRQS